MAYSLQNRYSDMVDAKLRYSLVQADGAVWNNRYEGDPKAGAVQVPVRDTEATVAAYNKASGVSTTAGVGTFLNVTINKDYAVNEVLDGFDAAAVPDNLVADRLDSAGYSLALQMNTDATTELVSGGTVIQKSGADDHTAITSSNAYKYFVEARTALSKAKVPTMGRFALVSPDVYAAILQDTTNFIRSTQLGDNAVANAAVGSIAGFTVYEDCTLPNDTDFIVGHPDWCARIKEWQVPVHMQDLSGSGTFIGASAVQGRMVYAHKVTKAAAVRVKKNA